MANYKVHLSTGVALGVTGCVLSLIFLLSGQYFPNFLIILFVSVGSIMPDLDSDRSTPFRIVFWIFSVVGGAMSFVFLEKGEYMNIIESIGVAFGVLFFIRFIIGWVFMKFTQHRGMFHSIPAALIFGLLCFYFLNSLKMADEQNIILSFALFLGYLSHLVLDEIYAGVNFEGVFLNPKSSLGSALKLFSKSQAANTVTYFILAVLIISLWPKVNPETFKNVFLR